MRIYIGLCLLCWTLQTAYAAITEANLKTFPNVLALQAAFNPVKDLYWTGMKTHRRLAFAASPGGKFAFLAYLDASGTGVHVQQVNLETFAAIGEPFTVPGGKEAGGLVVPEDEDGFALMTNEPLPEGTADAPPENGPIPVLYRVKGGKLLWKTYLAGPGIHENDPGLGKAVDMNGDLVWSSQKRLFGAYFVVSYYTGQWAGHFADSHEYVDEFGKLQIIEGATNGGGCSHNTGIALAEADDTPFASACAEDQQGGVWLNTKTLNAGPPSPLLSKEPFINGMSGEPLNGSGGSWKVLIRLPKTQQYAITWLTRNTHLDNPKSPSQPDKQPTEQPSSRLVRRHNTKKNPDTGDGGEGDGAPPRNVAIAILTDKYTVGTKNIITQGPSDHFNVHVQAFNEMAILSTYEEIANPNCVKAAGCLGEFSGTYFAQLDTSGKVVGEPLKSLDVTVGGDLVLLPSGDICFPYVEMKWDYSTKYDPSAYESNNGNSGQNGNGGNGGGASGTRQISFACISTPNGGRGKTTSTTTKGNCEGTESNTNTEDGCTKKKVDKKTTKNNWHKRNLRRISRPHSHGFRGP